MSSASTQLDLDVDHKMRSASSSSISWRARSISEFKALASKTHSRMFSFEFS